jgi:hypothetical protein
MELNVTHQFLVHANGVNIFHGNINTVKKNKAALLEASRKDGLEVNIEKAKCMVVSRHQNVG